MVGAQGVEEKEISVLGLGGVREGVIKHEGGEVFDNRGIHFQIGFLSYQLFVTTCLCPKASLLNKLEQLRGQCWFLSYK